MHWVQKGSEMYPPSPSPRSDSGHKVTTVNVLGVNTKLYAGNL